MRLRNKKTGEIVNAMDIDLYTDVAYLKISKDGKYDSKEYNSLAELNEEWEDYKEPKKYWFIDAFGNIVQNEITKHRGDKYTDMTDAYESQKLIGNYFETEEEAEKVREKMKALANLRKRGLKFNGWDSADRGLVGEFEIYCDAVNLDGIEQELELVFGREEI